MADVASDVRVAGTCAPGFDEVRAAFEENFWDRRELGASVCVRANGETLVDLWGGIADPETDRPWERDTVGVIFSATKGAAVTCVHLLAGRGEIELERPVADYWPEFARKGKEHITVFDVLVHQAGLSALRTPLPEGVFFDAEATADLIAAEAPFFPPGRRHGYSGLAMGYVLDALVRRTDGRSR